FEPPPVPHLLAALNVLLDRKRELDEQGYQTEKQWQLVDLEEAVATVNRALEVGTQGRIDVGPFSVLVEQIIASLQGGLGERKRERFRSRFRCVAVCHVRIRGRARLDSASADHHEAVLVFAAGGDAAGNARPDVDRRVEALQRSVAKGEAQVDEKAGEDPGKKPPAISGDRAVRRENNRFFSPPMHGCHYAFSKSVRVLIAKLRLCFLTSAIVPSKTSGVIFCPVVSGLRRFVSMSRRPIISTNSGLTGGSPEARASSSRMSCRISSPGVVSRSRQCCSSVASSSELSFVPAVLTRHFAF